MTLGTTRPDGASCPWWAALAVAAAIVLAPAPAPAQQDGDAADELPPVEAESGFQAGEPGEMDAIDEILEGEMEVLGGAAHSYEPGDRRDPFRSLLVRGESPQERGPRPEGIPGLLIDELRLSGIYRTAQGWVAQVQAAANEKGYLIKEGDQLYDGDVVSVTRDEVVFRQIVRDPAALKPFQEVTKRLNP
jgi:hypothetical protein